MIFLVFATVAVVAIAYAFARPYLRAHPWLDPFYDWIEPIEAHLWRKSRTILTARLYSALGILLWVQDFGLPALNSLGFDFTSLLPFPWNLIVGGALFATGQLFEQLRKATDAPVAPKPERAP